MNRINPLIIAHRGASSIAPENTFAAFDKALAVGADGIEFDVQLSKDNHPVIIHDETLERTTSGRGFVQDHSLSALQALDAGSWFGIEFRGARIPSLEQLFERYKNSSLMFNIELKNNTVAYPGIEEAVLNCIAHCRLEERVIISSFNHDSLLTCRKLNPAVRTGMLYVEEVSEPWQRVRSLGCYSAHPLFFYLQNLKTLQGYRDHNIALYPWVVNDPEQMKLFAAQKLEAIITDYPQTLKQILATEK